MKKIFWILLLSLTAPLWAIPPIAQEEPVRPAISVSSTGKTTARADLAIVFMTIRSSAPLAADALEQDNKKVQAIKERLTALGYESDKIKFSGNRFAPAGSRMFYGGERPTGFDVSNCLYVSLEGSELADISQFNTRVGSLLDELSKLGASAFDMPISRISMGGSSVVVFTVKDPAPYTKQAYQQAMEKAQPMTEEIARRMRVQLTGIESVTSTEPPQMTEPYPTPLSELPDEYVSSSMEEVPVRVNVVVRYSYK